MRITEYMANRHAEAVRRREEREQAAATDYTEVLDIITGEKECLFDGMGKQEPYVNPSYFDSISDLIFDRVFNFANQGVNFMSNVSNCCGNFIYKAYAIDNANGGKTDAAIAKL